MAMRLDLNQPLPRTCPSASSRHSWPTSPVTVEHAVDDFMEALWEAIAIVLAVSLLALGVRAGAAVALSIPLVLAVVFVTMMTSGIDLQRISLGALIIALGLLVDDAMITIESMVTRLERGDEKEKAAAFAYSSTAMPRLAGTLVTIAGSSRSASQKAPLANTPSRSSRSSPSR
jgi:multidrug efflux pump subunit AcrB